MMLRPTPEQMAIALRLTDEQFGRLYNSEGAQWIRSGQAANDAAAQDAKDIREIDAWMKKTL